MAYELFLFDLDDTLLDFGASERQSFLSTLNQLGISDDLERLFSSYQAVNKALWKAFENGETSKEHLKVERFQRLFENEGIMVDSKLASELFLSTLPKTVVLIDHAVEICEWLSSRGVIGIVTNGIQSVQMERIKNSAIAPYISNVCVSEECGFAKPDVRFFEHVSNVIENLEKSKTLVIGDRLEADIQGAKNFGVDSVWFNPNSQPPLSHLQPRYEIKSLRELKHIVGGP